MTRLSSFEVFERVVLRLGPKTPLSLCASPAVGLVVMLLRGIVATPRPAHGVLLVVLLGPMYPLVAVSRLKEC